MAEKDFSYSEAKARLDEIVAEVRRKDISLEKSLDLLEEAGRLASHCTDLIDQADSLSQSTSEETPAQDGATDGASSEVPVEVGGGADSASAADTVGE